MPASNYVEGRDGDGLDYLLGPRDMINRGRAGETRRTMLTTARTINANSPIQSSGEIIDLDSPSSPCLTAGLFNGSPRFPLGVDPGSCHGVEQAYGSLLLL